VVDKGVIDKKDDEEECVSFAFGFAEDSCELTGRVKGVNLDVAGSGG